MTDEQSRGRFVWFDLLTTDPNATTKFYPPVTGWGTERWNGGSSGDTIWTANSEPLGSVAKITPPFSAPHWLAYIATPDVDDIVVQAEDLGARILSPTIHVPAIGRFAVLADPQGAMFAAVTPDDAAPGREGAARLGEFSWHELGTHDYPAAYRFYERLFGWEKADAIDMGGGSIYQMFKRRGTLLGGIFNRPADSTGSPSWLHYVLVDDIERAAETVTGNGGRILAPVREVPGGDWIVECADPQGAKFALHQRKQ